jgi:peptide/nickel transport system substrate-binding protein
MLAKIGEAELRAQTRNLYFAKIPRKNDFKPGETSLHAGLVPAGTYDVHNVFEQLIQTPSATSKKGPVQCRRLLQPGGRQAGRRHGAGDRQGQARRDDPPATKLYVDDYAYIPLHQRRPLHGRRARMSIWSSRPTTASRCGS